MGHHPFINKGTEVRVVVGITCCLSIIGALLIILSYVCFKELRTRARTILLHISIMDLGVAASNLVGASVYFDHYYNHPNCLPDGIQADPHICPVSDTIHDLCVAQAFLAAYFSLGSIMWTICLSVYLYFLLVHYRTKLAHRSLCFSYIFSYCMPLFLSLWLFLTGRLGYSPYDTDGWCGVKINNPLTGEGDIFLVVFGYDLWIYLTIVLVPILSASVHLRVTQMRKSKTFLASEVLSLTVQNVDYKFILIPVAFILLRIWSAIVVFLLVYVGIKHEEVPNTVAIILINLSGIGDSGQGITNAILFVLFSKKVRESIFGCCERKKHELADQEERLLSGQQPETVNWTP